MILIVGAGSQLALSFEEFAVANSHDYALVSRERPAFGPVEKWTPTTYETVDQRLRELVGSLEIETLVWLAAPFSRSLFARPVGDDPAIYVSKFLLFQSQLVREVLNGMIARGFGRLVFAGSVGAMLGDVGSVYYTTLKHAQQGLSRGLAIEYGKLGITSNVIDLGLLSIGLSDEMSADRFEEHRNRTAIPSLVNPRDFWNLVGHLIENPSVNGSAINLDGGFR